MADVFLIVTGVVIFLILLVSGFYLLVHYQHPDDHNDAYFPKVVVVLGFVLAGATVLLLPLDVANREGYAGCAGYDTDLCGGLPMTLLWDIVFWMVPIWVFILIPFATFYYEADDGLLMAGTAYAPNPVKKSRFRQALCYQIFVLIIVGAFFGVMYILLSDTKIPVQEYKGQRDAGAEGFGIVSEEDSYSIDTSNTNANATFVDSLLADMDENDESWVTNTEKLEDTDEIILQVSMSTFYAGLMAWLGWWLFAIFGGIGLSAVPLDLILTFKHRPKHLDAVQVAEIQMSLRERVNELVDIGEIIKIEREQKAQAGKTSRFGGWSLDNDTRKSAREERQAILGFKQAVYLLEEDVDNFQAATADREKYNPLIPYIALLLGLCAIIISIFWFIHIIIYILIDPPLTPFLNNYFEWFDDWFPMFGVLSVAIFTFYLLLASVKGAFKFGMRFLFLHIHPMKPGKTYMSSFMFNIALVLLSALPVVQFCQDAFSDYAQYTDIRQIFGVQIEYLQFFSIFWTNDIFIYIFVGFTVLTGLYLMWKPNDQSASGQALRDRLHVSKT